MTAKILVPLDGSKLAERILIHVRRLLHSSDAEVVLLRVIGSPDEAEEARANLEAVANELIAAGAQASTRLVMGDAASRIVDIAAEVEPSVIAMSTHGRTGLSRLLLGSVAEKVIPRAPAPLLVANPFALGGTADLRFRKVLVPLDGTARAADAIAPAVEIARTHGAELVLFAAVDASAAHYPDIALRHGLDEANVLLAQERAKIEGLPVRTRIEQGPAADMILDAIDEEPIDLVVLASSGRGALDKFLNGSVSDRVIRRCPCPILVARAAVTAPQLSRSES